MAGIVGIVDKKVNPKYKVEPVQIGKLLNLIRHRGPDNSTVRSFPGGALGAVELNTSPLATYAFAGQEKPLVLLDGDLYNSRPTGMSNVSLLRELYLKYGKDCFSHLDGCFACAIIDKDEIILARDPLGVRYLVYGSKNNEFYFASEAKALKDHLSEITLLPPGHYYSTREGLRSFKAFVPQIPDFDPENLEETCRVVKETMIEAVEKCMADGALGGVALSGGFDSSVVTGILVKEFGLRLPQFTSTIKRMPGPDLAFSRLLAKYYNLENQHYIREITDEEIIEILPWAVWYLESFDQDCISGWIANYYTAQKAAEFTNCVFVGETADEISGGYFGEFEDENGVCWVKFSQMAEINQKLIDIAGDTGLRRLNQGWHSASVTPRTAFPDAKLVAVFKKIPMKWKYNENYNREKKIPEVPEKWILRKALEEYLPPEIAWRKKMRFARGVGVDALMDELAGEKVSPEEFAKLSHTPITAMALGSRKELYYYNLFTKQFPITYENLCIRWDPFIK